MILAEIFGPDLLIVIGLLVLLFGGGQIPKLARSLGQAKREFEKGLSDGDDDSPTKANNASSDTTTHSNS